jgi:hypothetical protein
LGQIDMARSASAVIVNDDLCEVGQAQQQGAGAVPEHLAASSAW